MERIVVGYKNVVMADAGDKWQSKQRLLIGVGRELCRDMADEQPKIRFLADGAHRERD
jgi:hypothetical protein